MMQWQQLLSSVRFGMEAYLDNNEHLRTEFQRDYDRLIFSSPFRRLQNKTQVFPLPGSVFVHNRLTHSLEVASVGRSIGESVGRQLRKRYPDSDAPFEKIGAIVSAACLAHDMGNPPFGHSGEKAISTFFSEGKGVAFRQAVEAEGGRWTDFTLFEGNANAIRLLTHQFIGRRKGGFALTYSTLASIAKYPYPSTLSGGKNKFGFFQSEEDNFAQIATRLGIHTQSDDARRYVRYPLVYLVEAADDICYQVMDIEDAHRLHIISSEQAKELFLNFFTPERKQRRLDVLSHIGDINEQISYLRASVIGVLIDACVRQFLAHEEDILRGTYRGALLDGVDEPLREAYRACSAYAFAHIYRSKEVLDIELAGYRIIGFLLEVLTDAIQNPTHAYSKLILNRIPEQYDTQASTLYGRLQAVVDYVSGMTDVYALDLYRKIIGNSLPTV